MAAGGFGWRHLFHATCSFHGTAHNRAASFPQSEQATSLWDLVSEVTHDLSPVFCSLEENQQVWLTPNCGGGMTQWHESQKAWLTGAILDTTPLRYPLLYVE